jgi:hypothetical protein
MAQEPAAAKKRRMRNTNHNSYFFLWMPSAFVFQDARILVYKDRDGIYSVILVMKQVIDGTILYFTPYPAWQFRHSEHPPKNIPTTFRERKLGTIDLLLTSGDHVHSRIVKLIHQFFGVVA